MRRVIIGFLASVGAIGLLLVLGVAIAVWRLLPPGPPEVPGRAVLTVDLREALAEAAPTDPLAQLGIRRELTLGGLLLALERAGADPRVAGLVARVSGEGPGLAQVQELRDAMARFRAAGKFALAYADSFGEFGPGTRGYYLATAFDQIHLQPLGGLGLTGLLVQTPLLGALLEALLDSLFGQVVAGIAEGRNFEASEVERLIDGGPYLAEEAEPAGLVDT